MKKGCLIALGIVVVLAAVITMVLFALIGSPFAAYNQLVAKEEAVATAWSQVENVYQRRADLIPNLVETVKGYATHERATLEAVTEARARVGSIQMTPELINNPGAFQQFQSAQGELSSALSRLMVVMEQYPNLKANEGFQNLQSQLEGSENRITVERMRFNEAAQDFNTYQRKFPQNLIAKMFGFRTKEYFQMQAGADVAPKVDFGATPAAAPAAQP